MKQALDPTLQFPVYPAAVLSVSAQTTLSHSCHSLDVKEA